MDNLTDMYNYIVSTIRIKLCKIVALYNTVIRFCDKFCGTKGTTTKDTTTVVKELHQCDEIYAIFLKDQETNENDTTK